MGKARDFLRSFLPRIFRPLARDLAEELSSKNYARAARKRSQSNQGPGSVLRPGAMSLWPAISSFPWRSKIDFVSEASASYCGSENGTSSEPSSSTPIEKSLQRLRPFQLETPACQARFSSGT